MATDDFEGFGVWRDLNTGVNPSWADPTQADGANDGPGIPSEPIVTRIEGPYGLPWFDAQESPFVTTGLETSPDPTYPNEDVGRLPIVGAYEGAFRTHGPVRAFGHEVSGGLTGDQALGRIMRFPANIPDRYDANGVDIGDYRDELAAAIAANDAPSISDQMVNTSLLLYPDYGWR